MITAAIEPAFTAWRDKARQLLRRGVRPEDVCWEDATQGCGLLGGDPADDADGFVPPEQTRVPPGFLSLASQVCSHTDERRFGVLYRLLHRLTLGGRRYLLDMPSDPDTRQCQIWAKAVDRETHHMQAYVRFRLVGVNEDTGREQFVAWFEPEFRVVRLAAPFFEKRFAGMDWSIITPDECVSWDGRQLLFLPGMRKEDAPGSDARESP